MFISNGSKLCAFKDATPGNSLPSRNSNDAPPPVEICEIRSATPARSTADANHRLRRWWWRHPDLPASGLWQTSPQRKAPSRRRPLGHSKLLFARCPDSVKKAQQSAARIEDSPASGNTFTLTVRVSASASMRSATKHPSAGSLLPAITQQAVSDVEFVVLHE